MAWYDRIPVIGNISGAVKGDWAQALTPPFLQPFGPEVRKGVSSAIDAIDPYDDKSAALAGLQEKLGGLKKERLDRIESAYGRSNAQLDDTRRAIAAMYGDPSTWRL